MVVTDASTERVTGAAGEALRSNYGAILAALEEIALRATERPALDDILRLVGQRLCELLGVCRCSVYLRGDDGLFHGQVGYSPEGHLDDDIKQLLSGVEGDEFTREIIASRAPVIIQDAPTDPRMIRRTVRRWDVRAMLGVPLLVDDELIGIIYVDNEDIPRQYSHEDIQIAQTFARLAGLTVQHCRMYTQLERRAAIIERNRSVLEKMTGFHTQLTGAVQRGEEVPELLRLLCTLVSKPVTLYTADFAVSGWAAPESMALTRPVAVLAGVLEHESVRGRLADLESGEVSALLPPVPELGLHCRHLLCQLVIEGKTAGYLGVAELGSRFNVIEVKAAEHGATALSLRLLAEWRQIESEGQAREAFLADLLHGRDDAAGLIRRAPLFGIDPEQPQLVLRAQYATEQEPDIAGQARRERLTRTLAAALDVDEPLVTSVPGADILLVPVHEDSPREALRSVQCQLRRDLPTLTRELPLAQLLVSSVCRDLSDLPAENTELRELAALLRNFSAEPQVRLSTDFTMLRVVVAQGRIPEARAFAARLLAPLADYDRSGHGPLLPTLRAFLDAGGIRQAAKQLGVHENTVRYRLGRIQNLSGIDYESLSSLMEARLALQVADLARDDGEGLREQD